MEKQGRRRIRVVLVPAPFQGHINPMLQLGSILHSNGFSITVVHAQYNSPKPSSNPDFSFLSLPDTSTDHKILSDELVPFVSQLNAKCKDRFRECVAGVMRQQGKTDDAIACVIYDEVMYFSGEAAKDLNLPSIILRTGSASYFLARTALVQLIKTEGHIPFPAARFRSSKAIVTMKGPKGKGTARNTRENLKPVDDRKIGKRKAVAKADKSSKRQPKKQRDAKKDPNKPKRPPSAFFVFLEEFRKDFKKEHPDIKAVSAVGKAGGEQWKSLSDAEKAPYEAKAAKKKSEYEKVMKAYNKKQDSARDDGEEESDRSKSEVHDDDVVASAEEDEGEEEEDDEEDD